MTELRLKHWLRPGREVSSVVRANVSSYGAMELKLYYQRNMLIGNLFVVLMVIVIFATLYIYSLFGPESVEIEPKKRVVVETALDIPPPESIEIEWDDPIGGLREKLAEWRGGNLVPVDDDLFIPDDYVIPTRDQRRDLVDWGNNTGIGGDTVVIEFKPPSLPEYPDINEFVPYQHLPEMIYEAVPDYPRLARQAGMEASVWIKALVDKNGIVIKAVVFKSSGSKAGFDEAAVAAALKCKYKPAVQNGYPVPAWVTYKVEFILNK